MVPYFTEWVLGNNHQQIFGWRIIRIRVDSIQKKRGNDYYQYSYQRALLMRRSSLQYKGEPCSV